MTMMANLDNWKTYFSSIGVASRTIDSNANALQLSNVSGSPIFRVVNSVAELNELHTKARQKASDIKRLLILALPLDHPLTVTSMPGCLVLPKFRVYGGHIADTFGLHGHQIEPEFLRSIKQEVLAVMANGTKIKTPLCDWCIKLLSSNWVYGTPSSLAQLDTLIALIASEIKYIGHVKARQLSFGRGCGEALLLPTADVVLKNNSLEQSVDVSDLRLISLESEMKNYSSARARIHPVFSNKYLTALAEANPINAVNLGYQSQIGPSSIGEIIERTVRRVPQQEKKVNVTIA